MQMSKYMHTYIYTCTRNAHTVGDGRRCSKHLESMVSHRMTFDPHQSSSGTQGFSNDPSFFLSINFVYLVSTRWKIRKKFKWPLWIIANDFFFLLCNLIIILYEKNIWFFSFTKKLILQILNFKFREKNLRNKNISFTLILQSSY